MRILVTGEQHWDCRELAVRIIGRFSDKGAVVVSETAYGKDLPCALAAIDLGLAMEQYPAHWGKPGMWASWRRNQMIEAGANLCLAFHRDLGKSAETLDVVRMALIAGIPTYLIDSEEAEPKQLDCRMVDHMVWRVTRPNKADKMIAFQQRSREPGEPRSKLSSVPPARPRERTRMHEGGR